MKTRWYLWGLSALGLLLLGASQAGASDSQGAARVEIRADESGGVTPEVHVWINGKEVNPGNILTFTENREEPGPGGRERPRRGAREQPPRGTQPLLGVMIAPLDEEARQTAKVESGVLVTEVMPSGPAAKAGIVQGDVIAAIDGRPVDSPSQLLERIHQFKPADKVKVAWLHEGKRSEQSISLGACVEAGGGREAPETPRERPAGGAFLGVMVTPLTKEAEEFAGTKRGVLIGSLTVDGPAAKAGIQAGDVIATIDGKDIETPDELVDLVRTHKPGDTIRISFYRAGKRNEAAVTLGESPGTRPGLPGAELPEHLWGDLGDLREYLEKAEPGLRQWMKNWQERGTQRPGTLWSSPEITLPPTAPYDMGKDMGRILERLDRMEKRLNDIEQRLKRLEK
jgi:membrane-associated protease RseP (regulator of RpoE activity)